MERYAESNEYTEHYEAVKEQISRIPYQFPKLEISEELNDIHSLQEEYFQIRDYKSYQKISAPHDRLIKLTIGR